LTAPVAGANFGVVVTLRLPDVELLALEVAALDEFVLDELLEEPHPASAVSAAHASSAGRVVRICTSTLA
jgi:hypothetical protein